MKELTIDGVRALLQTGLTFTPTIQKRIDDFVKNNPESFPKETEFLKDPKKHKKYLKAIAGVDNYIRKPFKYAELRKKGTSQEEARELLKVHNQAEKERKESIQKEKQKIWEKYYPQFK